jgi:hypothetical protein
MFDECQYAGLFPAPGINFMGREFVSCTQHVERRADAKGLHFVGAVRLNTAKFTIK